MSFMCLRCTWSGSEPATVDRCPTCASDEIAETVAPGESFRSKNREPRDELTQSEQALLFFAVTVLLVIGFLAGIAAAPWIGRLGA